MPRPTSALTVLAALLCGCLAEPETEPDPDPSAVVEDPQMPGYDRHEPSGDACARGVVIDHDGVVLQVPADCHILDLYRGYPDPTEAGDPREERHGQPAAPGMP